MVWPKISEQYRYFKHENDSALKLIVVRPTIYKGQRQKKLSLPPNNLRKLHQKKPQQRMQKPFFLSKLSPPPQHPFLCIRFSQPKKRNLRQLIKQIFLHE